MKTRITRQAALNCDRFAALPVGALFTTYYGSVSRGYFTDGVYSKVDDETVQATVDGRRWKLGQTNISGSSVILVPEGSRSIIPFDARANNQYVELQ